MGNEKHYHGTNNECIRKKGNKHSFYRNKKTNEIRTAGGQDLYFLLF